MSSVMPASRTTIREPPPLADVEHPGDEPARPGDEQAPGLDRERGPAAGPRAAPRGSAAAAAQGGDGTGRGTVRPAGTERPGSHRRRRACRRRAGRRRGARAGRAPGGRASRHASTAPEPRADVEVDARARRSGPSGPPPASIGRRQLVVAIPNLLVPAPTARPAWVSGLTVRVEPQEHVEPRPPARPRPAARGRSPARAAASTSDSIATQRSGCPRPPRAPPPAGRRRSCRSPRA